MTTDEYITLKEAAQLLGCSVRTVRRKLDKHPEWDTFLDTDRNPDTRVVARKDVMAHAAENGKSGPPDAVSRDTDAPVTRDVVSRVGELQKALEQHTAEMRRANRLRLLELAATIGIGLGGFAAVIYFLQTFEWPG
jgi:hypothetical protein